MSTPRPPVDDRTYNLLQVLTSKLEALAAYEIYIEDMDGKDAEALRKIAQDDQQHAETLMQLIGLKTQ